MQASLWDQMVAFFMSAFRYPGLSWKGLIIGIVVSIIIGAVWLLAYRPRFKNKLAIPIIAIVSALLTWASISFVQSLLEVWSSQALLHFWTEATITRWLLLAGIPAILSSGIVQEAAKLVPVILFKLRGGVKFDARAGLAAGAIAGAGFGVFEALWVFNTAFANGLSWQSFQTNGMAAFSPFIDRFFAVGFHIAASALAGYGLATGKGVRFYLLAALLHGTANYSLLLAAKGVGNTPIEIGLALFTIALTVVVLSLRWKKAPAGAREDVLAAGAERDLARVHIESA